MMQAREAQNEKPVTIEDLKLLMQEAEAAEQTASRKFGRMARGAANTDSKIATITGVTIGVLIGLALAFGLVPGAAALSSINALLPIVIGAFCAGIGLLIGTYIDLHGVSSK